MISLPQLMMAFDHELHHFGCILGEVKLHHFFIELLHLCGWDADCVDPSRHENAIHHESGGPLVPVEKELLQGTEQEKGSALFEWGGYLFFKDSDATDESFVQFQSAGSGSDWGVAAVLTQANVRGVVRLNTFPPEMPPFQRLVPRHKTVKLTERCLIEGELPGPYQGQEPF